jgi:ferredoxin
LQRLKRIRIALALAFFLAVSLLFLNPGKLIPAEINTVFVSLQVVPSLIRTLTAFGAASVGLFVVLVVTLAYGRVYCSTICPLGTLQDIVIRLAKRINRRRRFRYRRPIYLAHYALFILSGILVVAGSAFLLNLLEPFSNFGRILSNAIDPVVALGNNMLVFVLERFGIFSLYRIPFLHISVPAILLPMGFLGVVIYLSYSHGRLFCNLLCPAGALLSLISRVSFFKIVIDKNNCKECGLCERACKAQCINSESLEVDFAACIGCFNCLDACPTNGMHFRARWSAISREKIAANAERREFLRASMTPLVGLFLPFRVESDSVAVAQNGFDENRKHPISPPGSLSVERFSNLCTACHLCVSACPAQVLYPSLFEYGAAGIFQPKMNYDASYCTYDCVLCTQICPTGAILPLDPMAKKEVQIGKTIFVRDDCIVVTKKTDCGACSEHCPTKAVKMVPYDHLLIPEVNDELCVGCGACEHACPTKPRKAIYVRGNKVHQRAKRPKEQRIENSFDSSQEFPF